MSFNEYRDDDEIRESRGWLPTWWMVLFWGAIAFSIAYGVYMHGVAAWSQAKQYNEEITAYEQAHPTKVVSLNEDGSNPFRNDPEAIARGKKTFEAVCAVCHKVDMTGLVGPNLSDATWLHGSTDKELFAVVMNGVPQEKLLQNPPKGPMPAHKNSLGSGKVLEVLAYIASKNPTLKAK